MNMMVLLLSTATLNISSPAFTNNGLIPKVYTCEGKAISPPLSITGYPANTKSLVIIVEDPDTDHGTFDHWVIYNITPTSTIAENSAPGTQGKNGKGKNGYTPPFPPTGKHRYFFKVYALDAMLDLKEGATKQAVQAAMKDHVIATGELIGLYEKEK